jgi:outer membrane receptor protein involved in Fe transport
MKTRYYGLAFATACQLATAQEMARVEVQSARFDQRREETASTLVLSRAELAAQGDRTLGDALRRLPGITIGTNSAGVSEIRMRGLGNGYTQVLLNGVAAPAGVTLDTLAPEQIERVDIVRSASAELGTQAIAGTINIILRKSVQRAQEWQLGLEQSPGLLSPRLSSMHSGSSDGWHYALGTVLRQNRQAVNRLRQDVDTALNSERLTAAQAGDITDTLSLTPRAQWQSGSGDTLNIQNLVSLSRRRIGFASQADQISGPAGDFATVGSRFRLRAAFLRSDLTWQQALAGDRKLEWKLGLSHSPRHTDFDFAGTPADPQNAITRHVQADIRESGITAGTKATLATVDEHALVLGWDGGWSQRAQSRLEQEYGGNDVLHFAREGHYDGDIRRLAAFAQDEWRHGPWSLAAGLRWEWLRTSARDLAAPAAAQASKVWSPVLQLLYQLPARDQLRLGLSRTYKAPTMVDLIPRRYTIDSNNSATDPDTQGNPQLRPELAWGLDGGYDHTFGKDGMLSASAYVRRIDDVTLPTVWQEQGRWITMQSNQGRANSHGIALEARVPLGALTLQANLARNWSRLASVPGPHNRLDQQTPLSASLGLRYTQGPLALAAHISHEGGGDSRQSLTNWSSSAPVSKLDWSATWRLDAKRSLRVALDNALHPDTRSSVSYRDSDGLRRSATTESHAAVFSVRFDWKTRAGN